LKLQDFQDFREQLKVNVENDDRVIGLVFLGSAADLSRVDEWSDHDFFLFVAPGTGEEFRQNLSWLPNNLQILLSPRETEHGLKVVYNDGHLLEFAVFDDELELYGVNAFEVVLDRGGVQERIEKAAERSQSKPKNFETEFEIFLAQILIGIGRARRGEVLSAGQFIRNFAPAKAMGLINEICTPQSGSEGTLDNQNASRRFEARFPEIARELEAAQQLDLESSGLALLEVTTRSLSSRLNSKNQASISGIKKRLEWV
jgi:hypothetical protein